MYRSILIVALLLLFPANLARAEERIALVIGNGQYEMVTSLDNPVADANLIASTLQSVGFQVNLLINANQSEMKRGIANFGRALRKAGPEATALFYYAGHGVQSQGNNYLLPVDSSIIDEADLDLVGVEADWVLRQLFSARNKTSIVILDACRNNPFTALADFSDQGLAEMKAPTGSFLAYATAPGDVALDGATTNSPYTEALAAAMLVPGVPIEQMFKQVRINVLKTTGGAQTPWDSSSLTGDFYFTAAAPVGDAELGELQLWTSVKETRDPVQLMLFLRAYPGSTFEREARELLAIVMDEELMGRAPDTPKQPVATVAEPETTVSTDPANDAIAELVTFLAPLSTGSVDVAGRSIETLAKGSPLFPPIEGLPESYWKEQKCSNCHQWNKERLCEQGNFYLKQAGLRSLGKKHPYGGTFKQNLKNWASTGCR